MTKLPSLAELDEIVDSEATRQQRVEPSLGDSKTKPFLVILRGHNAGLIHEVRTAPIILGRSQDAGIWMEDVNVSRKHARVFRHGDEVVLEDLGSANGTYVNGERVSRVVIREGDQISLGPGQVLKLEFQNELEESARRKLFQESRRERPTSRPPRKRPWSPESWKKKSAAQVVHYGDPDALKQATERLRRLPPLVTSWEIEELKRLLAEAQDGQRFLLQGGDCAETFDDCSASIITNKLKILLQMSLVLIHGAHRPVIRVGRFAGQYAKPRSRPTEVRNGVELPSYVGDIVNRPTFTPEARRPDPGLLVSAYEHAAMTLNFIRAMSGGGFTDLRRPEYYDLSFFDRSEQTTSIRRENQSIRRRVSEALHFVTALGKDAVDELARAFFTSHEGLNLFYESAQTRKVPRRDGFYDLTTHLPWIGERTRALDGAHVEFFRGIANPIGVKIGPGALPEEVLHLCDVLNQDNERGKIVLVARMGADKVSKVLPPLIEATRRSGRHVLWVSDPMHGNTIVTRSGVKTRNFDAILREVELSMEIHSSCDSYFGGVHFELTGEDVTECVGGGIVEQDLTKSYLTACDPRLNYRQAVEMAYSIARHMRNSPATIPPDSERSDDGSP